MTLMELRGHIESLLGQGWGDKQVVIDHQPDMVPVELTNFRIECTAGMQNIKIVLVHKEIKDQ